MSKYILAGGKDRKFPEYWSALATEIGSTKSERPFRVLSCFFSQSLSDWNKKFELFVPHFKIAFGEDAECKLASLDNFLDELNECDIVYLHGGTTHMLKGTLSKYKNIADHFKDKVVVGSSAGANYLSVKGWSPGMREVIDGAGIVPLNVIVHFGSNYGDDDPRGPIDWEKAEQDLRLAIEPNATITRLTEGSFIVVEQ